MEAKVDVRKLQLLNDRIAQTIEALNQVRLSVHGLSHTPGLPTAIPFTPPTVPFTGYGMVPNFPAYPGVLPGLQHTPFTPYTPYTPYTPQTPFSSFIQNVPGIAPLPFMSGLSHSPELLDPRLMEFKGVIDPYRMAQTFPFINTPYWPSI